MIGDLQRPQRRSIRLRGYDYVLAGAYFVTIVAQNRAPLFGTIRDGVMHPSPAGEMLAQVWAALPERFPTVVLDAFVVMPNHVHGVVILVDPARQVFTDRAPLMGAPTGGASSGRTPTENDLSVGAPLVGARLGGANTCLDGAARNGPSAPTLGEIIGAWKSLTTVAYINGVKQAGWPPFPGRLWQRNFYEHIIRNDEDLANTRRYILTNPETWAQDTEYIG